LLQTSNSSTQHNRTWQLANLLKRFINNIDSNLEKITLFDFRTLFTQYILINRLAKLSVLFDNNNNNNNHWLIADDGLNNELNNIFIDLDNALNHKNATIKNLILHYIDHRLIFQYFLSNYDMNDRESVKLPLLTTS
jgi:hypothetical protein